MSRVFLLSPASLAGKRAGYLLHPRGRSELARRLHAGEGVPIGEVMTFCSGLYFRGKVAYARAFARPPAGEAGAYVITAAAGLWPLDEPIGLGDLKASAEVPIDEDERRYSVPLVRDARRLAALPACEAVLLGSIATGKYVDVLGGVLGARLLFPATFVGRGDMSRGGLMLRSARAGRELDYAPVAGAVRHGPRPPRLGSA